MHGTYFLQNEVFEDEAAGEVRAVSTVGVACACVEWVQCV